ncbi:MAG TPA: ParB/RepB/Spo0J family partition protein, partial [Immundisolibacter sp.]|nr:ParB/RepB/Spo0J family partition protein [Immundisolibacter sp.]
MAKSKKPAPKSVAKVKKAAPQAAPKRRAEDKIPQRRASDKPPSNEQLLALDAGYQAARQNAVTYLHGRRQAVFALARRYHLEPDDIQQEAYEILLTCLRDFNPTRTDEHGNTTSAQFNTFFGSRLEGKAMELRNKDPEYQARQAHTAGMTDDERESFRKNPPLLVQHLDQETTMQEHLQSEVSGAQRARQGSVRQKVLQDSYIDRKLTELIAAERDDQRRAALLQVKVGGLSTFDDIAYHFGVTDSRASQILNDLMDAFYVQRLLDGDLKSVAYDFRKQKLNDKRALRLLAEAINNAPPPRAQALADIFRPDYAGVDTLLAARSGGGSAPIAIGAAMADAGGAVAVPADQPQRLFSAEDLKAYPPVEVGWREVSSLSAHPQTFRSPSQPAEPAHIARLMQSGPEHWPLIITEQGVVIDGVRRLTAARAKKIDRVLCHVHKASEADAAQLRVVLNLRAIRPDKLDLYFAITALLGLGLSQGKVATALETSRPNVIVYAKVAEKAAPELRQLFEDGLIQVTNASAGVDLPAAAQAGLARAIRAL